VSRARPLVELAVAELNGTIWVLGGYPPGRLPSDLVQVYDPATLRWTLGPSLPQRNHLAMSAVNGRILVAGGRFEPGAFGERTDVVEIYDPATRRWTRGAPLPAPVGGDHERGACVRQPLHQVQRHRADLSLAPAVEGRLRGLTQKRPLLLGREVPVFGETEEGAEPRPRSRPHGLERRASRGVITRGRRASNPPSPASDR
jgi:hypothetical protein